MSAPIVMVVTTPHGAHLADYPVATAWCGIDARGFPAMTLEPGVDMGERADDCPECLREWRRRGR